ncbi:MAG: caspase family protein [Pseudomonadota bacterium]
MHAIRFVFLFVTVALMAPVEAAWAAKRVALVIGNSDHEHVPELANPANDAADMSARLKSLGFLVIEGRDLTLTDMRNKVREFMATLSDADIGLFYYAGHGLQVNGKNYLAPVDAQLIT